MLSLSFSTGQVNKVPDIAKLWKETYGDDDEFIERCIYNVAGIENVYLAYNGNELASFLLAVPCSLKSSYDTKAGIYMYALSTVKAMRGKGIMTKLVKFAEESSIGKGRVFSTLIPASDKLFSFYAKLGYQREIMLRLIDKKIDKKPHMGVEYKTLTSKQFQTLRSEYADNNQSYVDFGVKQYAVILKDLYNSDVQIAGTDSAYCVYKVEEKRINVLELFAVNEKESLRLLESLAYKNDMDSFTISLGEGSMLFQNEGSLRRYAVIKNLKSAFGKDNAYLRLGLDEVGRW